MGDKRVVLVPVSRFSVEYEVASGRPYSDLESLVLESVAAGTRTLNGLHDIFCLHKRLIVEALVTLTQAGWLAVGVEGSEEFLLTAEGKAAAEGRTDTPGSQAVFPKRRALVIMERIAGTVLPNDAMTFTSRRDLIRDGLWKNSQRLDAKITHNALGEADVQHLLRMADGEWLRWVGKPTQLTKGYHWVNVQVDPDSGDIAGLPWHWTGPLTVPILEAVRGPMTAWPITDRLAASRPIDRRIGKHDLESVVRRPTLDRSKRIVALSRDDLLFTRREHATHLRNILETAGSAVFVGSAFMTLATVQNIESALRGALARGVHVDLLWGYDADTNAVAWVRSVAANAKHAGHTGLLRLNSEASRSHAKIVLGDPGGHFQGTLGSYNWLSGEIKIPTSKVGADREFLEASAILREPFTVAQLARSAASLWLNSKSGRSESTPERWQRIAAEQERLAAAIASNLTPPLSQLGATTANAQIIYDRRHESVIHDCLCNSTERLIVASHRIGPAAVNRLLIAADRRRGQAFKYVVIYGLTDLDTTQIEELVELVSDVGGTLRERPDVHAKVLVSDATVYLGSYNPLSADPFGTAASAKEVGLLLESSVVADWVVDALASDDPT